MCFGFVAWSRGATSATSHKGGAVRRPPHILYPQCIFRAVETLSACACCQDAKLNYDESTITIGRPEDVRDKVAGLLTLPLRNLDLHTNSDQQVKSR
jgi:hypothetical protein